MKKIITLILSILVLSVFTNYAGEVNAPEVVNEDNKVEDKWVEIQSTIIPFDLEVNSGVTSKGNPKYWFTFDKIGDVSLSVSNYKKYIAKSEQIELVKWQKGNKYKYTTRAKAKDNVDLTKIFEK